ncbi:MAG: protein phosphatase CheZ [Rhodocyclaceae bacterium]|nr:protein phosphatase CheZ [Rhodocyclaceae bacterium]
MAKPINFDESGDSEDLQSLFDSIAAGRTPAPPPTASPRPNHSGDSDELQALFDSVAEQVAEAPKGAASAAAGDMSTQEVAFNRIGHMARQLHDSLRELGYDKMLENTAKTIPDARQRLTYIAQMTEQAASRVLNATDIAKPLQDSLLANSEALGARWNKMFANQLSVDEFKALAADSRAFFQQAPAKIKATNDQLTDIMMAQDFQDLTGQVIKKVVEMVQGLESQLLTVLIEVMPEERKAAAPESLMNGPVVSADGRSDVVTTQAQVDDLLESLGF